MASLDKALPAESIWIRIRRAALWLLFAGVLLIPKTLALRRRPALWNTARLIAAFLGVALIAARLAGLLHATSAAMAGAALLILALAVRPERSRSSPTALTDALARKLGALVVVRGGAYYPTDGAQVETRFFVGPERLWIFGASGEPLFELPLAGLAIHAEPANDSWKLCLAWDSSTAEFLYQGPFAEHFAQVAESTVRSQVAPALPILR